MKNILIVHSQLNQHGSEKLLFEIIKLLKLKEFNVDVLTRPFFIKNQYYYNIINKMGINIVLKFITFRHITFFTKFARNKNNLSHRFFKNIYKYIGKKYFFHLYSKYDKIIIIGMETYCDSFYYMDGEKTKILVHHVMHQFQQERNYCEQFDLDRLIILDLQQEKEIKKYLPDINLIHFPLPINLNDYSDFNYSNIKKQYTSIRKLKIGVVSRVVIDRPNEPIFVHFSKIANIIPAELHFFGRGDPKIYKSLLRSLGLDNNKIFFHGHSNSIIESFKKFEIDLAWSVSMNGSISYSAIEMIAMKIPVFFINIGDKSIYSYGNKLNIIESEDQTIEFHNNILKGKCDLKMVAESQFTFIANNFASENLLNKLLLAYDL